MKEMPLIKTVCVSRIIRIKYYRKKKGEKYMERYGVAPKKSFILK